MHLRFSARYSTWAASEGFQCAVSGAAAVSSSVARADKEGIGQVHGRAFAANEADAFI